MDCDYCKRQHNAPGHPYIPGQITRIHYGGRHGGFSTTTCPKCKGHGVLKDDGTAYENEEYDRTLLEP